MPLRRAVARLVQVIRFRVGGAPGRRIFQSLREHSAVQLWAPEQELVQRLLTEGRDAEAVEEYFARVGERWDNERLVVRRFEIGENRIIDP